MTPVSIKQLKVTSRQKSRWTQKVFRDKLNASLKTKCEQELDDTTKHEDLNHVFAIHREKDEIYPFTTREIAKSQKEDQELQIYYKKHAKTQKGYAFSTYWRHNSAM